MGLLSVTFALMVQWCSGVNKISAGENNVIPSTMPAKTLLGNKCSMLVGYLRLIAFNHRFLRYYVKAFLIKPKSS